LAVPVMDGLVPVTVTVYVPPLPVQLSVLVPVPPVMMAGVSVHVRPVVGEMVEASVTVPVKPFSGRMSMLVVPATLGVVLMVAGLASIWKSTTWTLIVCVVWDNELLVPVTLAM
jgi:hypothetical protein